MSQTQAVIVPAGEARAVTLSAGQRAQIIDVEGGQVADTFVFCAEDPTEHLSAQHTRVEVSRLFPALGQPFFTNVRRPIVVFEEDTSPGIHDMLCAACDPGRYALMGVEGWHASCQENLARAMAEHGYPSVPVPQPVNLFMNTPVIDAEGTIGWFPAPSRAGDYVALRAVIDCVLCVSSCPQDMNDINGRQVSPLAIELA